MKIRDGFVSNSSTSSYIVRGHYFDYDNVDDLLLALGLKETENRDDDDEDEESESPFDWESEMLTKLDEEGIEVTHDENNQEFIVIGPSFTIDYCEDITKDLQRLHDDSDGQLAKIEEKLGFKVEDAKIWGVKSEG